MEEFRDEILDLAKKIYDAGVKKAEDESEESSDAYSEGLLNGFNFCKKLFFLSNKTKEKIFGTDVMRNIFKTYSVDEIKEALRDDANKYPIGTKVVTIKDIDPYGTGVFPIGTVCRIVAYHGDDSNVYLYKLRRDDESDLPTTWWYTDDMIEVIKEEEALKIGDELINTIYGYKAIVTRIDDDEYVDVIYNTGDRKGVVNTVNLSHFKKTGKNYSQLVDLLNMLDNSNSNEEEEEDE